MRLGWLLVAAACIAAACDDSAEREADVAVMDDGSPDGQAPDAAGPDGAPSDAAPPDSALADAALPDVAQSDSSAPDAARPDAELPDAELPDAELPDAELPDAELPDAAPCEAPTEHVAPPLIEVNACGRLSYGLYANRGEGEQPVHRLPDFSHAGYMGGGVALPDVPVVAELDGPSGDDDRARIQAALDAVAERDRDPDGFRGALLLRRGEWRVDGTLYIRASGVVLRGEGQGAGGTRVVATRAEQHDLIVLDGNGRGLGEVDGTRQRVEGYAPVGSRRLTLASTDGFSAGDVVGVLRTPNQRWIDTLGMGQWGWTPDSYIIAHERRITAVDGDTITVDVPLVDTLDPRFGGGAVFRADVSGRIRRVGVEDLRLISLFDGAEDEAHGWKAVRLNRVRDGWVRRVTAEHFGYAAVSIEGDSSFNTVEEVAMLDPVSQVTGGRRYSFNVSSGTGNLFQRCYSERARHDFVSGARTTGPNVWLDCYSARSSSDDGPHHRWATGLLFDNVASRYLHVENRADSGSGHGWSGAQTLFYNALAEGVRCDAPIGAMNWTVGTGGAEQEGQWVPEEPPGWWESANEPVEPRSLYLRQLAERLGPDAVRAVTTPEQRVGRIWGHLAAWAGEGRLADVMPDLGDPDCAEGVARGHTCCDAACGECGGAGCGARPGGSAACCTGAIGESGRSCAFAEAPCVIDPPFAPLE